MPQNMERIGNNVEDERTEEQKRNDERRTGAKILAGAGFQDRQKEITDSSLKKMTARGENHCRVGRIIWGMSRHLIRCGLRCMLGME